MTLLVLLVGCFAYKELVSMHSATRQMARSFSDLENHSTRSLNLDESISVCPSNRAEIISRTYQNSKETKIQFHNSAKAAANLFWYDYQGNPRFKKKIPSNGFYATKTWEGHAFRVWNEDLTRILLDFRVGRKAVDSAVQKGMGRRETMSFYSEIIELGDVSPHIWDDARSVGFVNRLDAAIDLFYVNSKGVERLLVSRLASGRVYYETTYHLHTFRARVHGDLSRRIVKEFQIGDVEIPDCEHSNIPNTTSELKVSNRQSFKHKNKIGWTWAIVKNNTISGSSM